MLSEAHRSLRDDFEISWPHADVTVEAAIAVGALGARMIGGGFGGSVLALVLADAGPAVRAAIADAFARHSWAAPEFIKTVPAGTPAARIPGKTDKRVAIAQIASHPWARKLKGKGRIARG